jgi:hypothetical protein
MTDGGGEGVDLGIPGLGPAVLVGRGGFGLVYRATQRSSGGPVAVKIAQGHLDATSSVRFEREAAALGALRGHPNICTVYDAGVDPSGRPYLVMELAPSTLADRIASDGPLPWEDVAALGVRMAGALETAHLAGLLHRDVKPENILRTPYGEWRLADFGLARRGEETLSSEVTATLSHAAPEFIEGAAPSVASDVYALGSTLFVALTGTTAFTADGAHAMTIMRRITEDPVPDMPGTPDPIADVVRRAMAKAPEDRYASAAEMGRALQQAQQRAGAGVTPLPVPPGDIAPRPELPLDADLTVDNRTPANVGDLTEAVNRGGRQAPAPEPGSPDEPGPPRGPNRRVLLTAGAVLGVVVLLVAALALRGGDPGDGADKAAATSETTETTVNPDEIELARDWYKSQITTDVCIGADTGPCPLTADVLSGVAPTFSVDCPPAEHAGRFGRSARQVAEPSCLISFLELEPAEASFDGNELGARFTSSTPPGGGVESERGPGCLEVPATYWIHLSVEDEETREGRRVATKLRGDLNIYVDNPADQNCGSYYFFSDFVVEAGS